MTKTHLFLLASILVAGCGTRTIPHDTPVNPSAQAARQATSARQVVSEEELNGLIQSLGADDYHDRESAQRTLVEAGSEAHPLLVRALASDDPEIAVRARQILDTPQDEVNPVAFPPFREQGDIPQIDPAGTDTNEFASLRGPGFVMHENALSTRIIQ